MDQGFDKMTREELMKHIQEGIKTEESAITIYARHLAAIVSRSGLPESKMSQIKRTLDLLIEANRRYKNLLDSLLKRIQGESIDVY
jgi:endonuclease III